MPVILAAHLAPIDWAIVAAYLALLIGSGLWLARREPAGSDEYFLASRRMPTWAVVFSILASSLSVATFLGAPDASYNGDLTYLSTNIGGILAVFIIARFFIPVFYRANCVSIYEILEHRMGAGAKRWASGAFMLGRLFASGARVYIAALPLAAIIFGLQSMKHDAAPLLGAIALLTLAAVVITLVGGIASVIWTDVLQTIVMLGAVSAGLVYLRFSIPASTHDIAAALSTGGIAGASKLTILDPGLPFNPAKSFTLLTALFGFSLLSLASYGTDHDMVQRMLTCRSAVKGGRSVLVATFVAIPVVALFMLIGLLLFVFYQRPDLMGASAPVRPAPTGSYAFLTFIVEELPAGLRGIMVAGIFAIGLGSLNSAINAMSATFVADFYTPWRPNRTDRHYLAVGRWAVVAWGIALGIFAALCIVWRRADESRGLIEFALSVMTFAYSGLLAVFLAALFTRRGNSVSAACAIIAGFLITAAFLPAVWLGLSRAGLVPIPMRFAPDQLALGAGEFGATLGDVKAALPFTSWAFPWQLLTATAGAFIVVVLGRSPPGRADALTRAALPAPAGSAPSSSPPSRHPPRDTPPPR
ncbi:sodium:solute symporter [soil metagenome]